MQNTPAQTHGSETLVDQYATLLSRVPQVLEGLESSRGGSDSQGPWRQVEAGLTAKIESIGSDPIFQNEVRAVRAAAGKDLDAIEAIDADPVLRGFADRDKTEALRSRSAEILLLAGKLAARHSFSLEYTEAFDHVAEASEKVMDGTVLVGNRAIVVERPVETVAEPTVVVEGVDAAIVELPKTTLETQIIEARPVADIPKPGYAELLDDGNGPGYRECSVFSTVLRTFGPQLEAAGLPVPDVETDEALALYSELQDIHSGAERSTDEQAVADERQAVVDRFLTLTGDDQSAEDWILSVSEDDPRFGMADFLSKIQGDTDKWAKIVQILGRKYGIITEVIRTGPSRSAAVDHRIHIVLAGQVGIPGQEEPKEQHQVPSQAVPTDEISAADDATLSDEVVMFEVGPEEVLLVGEVAGEAPEPMAEVIEIESGKRKKELPVKVVDAMEEVKNRYVSGLNMNGDGTTLVRPPLTVGLTDAAKYFRGIFDIRDVHQALESGVVTKQEVRRKGEADNSIFITPEIALRVVAFVANRNGYKPKRHMIVEAVEAVSAKINEARNPEGVWTSSRSSR